ncbi:neural cell adhesion molecule 2-like isoform X3 [Amphiura filiformis]|uniref:neural cell adhesion molecule 2-like isoform X3 n=1 Tax=Amphiura filiformis TaxID=82378 RepID=UPI003B20D5DA
MVSDNNINLEGDPRFGIEVSFNQYETVVISRLTFYNPLPMDSGMYQCSMVSSAVGTAEVPVKFWTAPVLTPVATHITVTSGYQHTLQCQVQGGFEGRLLWLKDNRYIGAEGSFDIDGDRIPDVRITPQSRTLSIINAKATDAGVYTCRFRYNYGNQWKSLASTIYVTAGVELSSDSYILWQGNQATPLNVKCTGTGYPLPSVSWSFGETKKGLRTGSWSGDISIYDYQISAVHMQSTMTIARMPGFFNITKFYCKGENSISVKSNTIMVVNVGKRRPTLGPTYYPLPTVALHLVAGGPLHLVEAGPIRHGRH